MSENNVNDLITDQEIAFAHLLFSGTMTDRQAAEAVGLNPETAANIKSKPSVCDYMLKHRAAGHDTKEPHTFSVGRDQVLTRLWEIANMAPERTRNSMSSQVKAISMIVAIEGLIPNRRAVSVQNEPAPPPVPPAFYKAEWLRNQQNGKNVDPQQPQAQEEAAGPDQQPAPVRAEDPPSPTPGPVTPAQTTSLVPRVPMADHFAPDTRAPFKIDKNRFGRRR
jgi:hypothetical protein